MHYIVFKSGECQFPGIALGMLYTKKTTKTTASIVLCDGLSIVLRHERRLKKTNKQILKCRLCKPLCVMNVALDWLPLLNSSRRKPSYFLPGHSHVHPLLYISSRKSISQKCKNM